MSAAIFTASGGWESCSQELPTAPQLWEFFQVTGEHVVPLLGAQDCLSGGRIQAAEVNRGRKSKGLFPVTLPTTHSADAPVTLLQLDPALITSLVRQGMGTVFANTSGQLRLGDTSYSSGWSQAPSSLNGSASPQGSAGSSALPSPPYLVVCPPQNLYLSFPGQAWPAEEGPRVSVEARRVLSDGAQLCLPISVTCACHPAREYEPHESPVRPPLPANPVAG